MSKKILIINKFQTIKPLGAKKRIDQALRAKTELKREMV